MPKPAWVEQKKSGALEQAVAFFAADASKVAAMEAEFAAAFPKEGIPDGAVNRYLDEAFPASLIRSKLAEAVREHFHPAVEVAKEK